MSFERAGLFEDEAPSDDLDLSVFAPKKTPKAEPPAEAIRTVSESAKFVSREPVAAAPPPPPAYKRDRRYRTGRNEQLNVKVTAECLRLFYDICDSQKWVQGETLERALAALERELKG